MIIGIKSDKPVQTVYLKDLYGERHDIQANKRYDNFSGWYELCIENWQDNTTIEIEDISIDLLSLGQLMYTGCTTNNEGKIQQPSTKVWWGSCFRIWIHTDIAQLINRVFEEIDNYDYGENLYEKYLVTVDRPYTIKRGWDRKIEKFFQHGDGPHWWKLNNEDAPWMPIDLSSVDVDQLLLDLDKFCTHSRECYPGGPWGGDAGLVRNKDFMNGLSTEEQDYGMTIKQFKEGKSDLPFVELDDIPYQSIKDFVIASGYKRLIDISVQTLKPGNGLMIHKEDHTQRECYPYIKGCKKVYWTVKGSEGVYFKLGKSGLLPLDSPLMINTAEIPHSVIHDGDEIRTSILVYGELN